MTDIPSLLVVAKQTALEAGEKVMEIYRTGDFQTQIKSGGSPYTNADKMAHKVITKHLIKTKLPVLSEEGKDIDFSERENWEYFWMIDPLDGTKEFIKKNGQFTINIALIKKNIPVAGVIYVPSDGALYFGSKETGVYKNRKGKSFQFLPLEKRNDMNDLLQKKQIRIVVSGSHPSDETTHFLNRFQQPIVIAEVYFDH